MDNDFLKRFVPPAHPDAEVIFSAMWHEQLGASEEAIRDVRFYQMAAKAGIAVPRSDSWYKITEIDVVENGTMFIVKGIPVDGDHKAMSDAYSKLVLEDE